MQCFFAAWLESTFNSGLIYIRVIYNNLQVQTSRWTCLIAINTFLALAVPDVNKAELTRHLGRRNPKYNAIYQWELGPWECYAVSLAKCTQRKTKKQARPFVWQGVCEWHPQESLELSPGQENGWGGTPFVEGSGCRKLWPGCGGQCWHHATRKDWHHGNKLSSAFSNLTVSCSGFVVGLMSAPQRKKPKLLTCWNI